MSLEAVVDIFGPYDFTRHSNTMVNDSGVLNCTRFSNGGIMGGLYPCVLTHSSIEMFHEVQFNSNLWLRFLRPKDIVSMYCPVCEQFARGNPNFIQVWLVDYCDMRDTRKGTFSISIWLNVDIELIRELARRFEFGDLENFANEYMLGLR